MQTVTGLKRHWRRLVISDNGLEYAADQNDLHTKANRKMILVGNSTQLTNLPTTYGGQIVFATTTGGVFTADLYYKRNAANTSWVAGDLTLESSQSSLISGDGTFNATFLPTRYYAIFTMPTTEKFYKITEIEWKNGTVVDGDITCGIDLVDADPPVLNSTPLLGVAQTKLQVGVSSIQSSPIVSCKPIRGGAVIGAWVSGSSLTAEIKYFQGSSMNIKKNAAYSVSPGTNNTTAWILDNAHANITIYFRGYNK